MVGSQLADASPDIGGVKTVQILVVLYMPLVSVCFYVKKLHKVWLKISEIEAFGFVQF